MSLKSRIASLFGLGQQPQTQQYVAWPTGMWHVHAQQQRPIFNAYWADLMQFDHQVAFGLSICNAPVLKAQVEVKSKSREIGQFVEKQWKKIWAQDAVRVLHAKCYGAMGYEVCYEVCDGRIEFLSLLDRHPRDTYPLVGKSGTPWAGRVVGLRIRSLKSPTDSTGIPPLARPKCLWLTYDAQHGSRWGRAILERAFGAWYERSGEGGAVEKRKLRMMKDAWLGDVMRYPLGGPFASIKLPNGTIVPSSELAREAIENRMSGAVMALPGDRDESGNLYFDYTGPTSVQGVSPILEYIKELDYDIFDGLGLPREVVEAASTGSGFSGRSIPFVAFLATRDIEFADDVRQIKAQAIDPMIVANFGHEAIKDYEIEPVPLIETVGELMGPMGQPNTTTANPQQPPQMPEGDGEPMQFAADDGEWITIGGNKSKPSGQRGGTPVKVKDGKIVSGPKALSGRKLKSLSAGASDSRYESAMRAASRHYGVDRKALRQAVDHVWTAKRDAIEEREAGKKLARQKVGITAADYNRLVNSGRDYTSIPHFDATSQELAWELPELGISPDDAAQAVWELISEGRQHPPARHDPEILEAAAKMVKSGSLVRESEYDAIPFSAEDRDTRWITINGGDGEGTPVKIDGRGNIVAGPSGLAEKGIRKLGDLGGGRSQASRPAVLTGQPVESQGVTLRSTSPITPGDRGESYDTLLFRRDGQHAGKMQYHYDGRTGTAEIDDTVLEPQFRGQGVLQAAWPRFVDHLKALGAKKIVAKVVEEKIGPKVWGKLGFREYGKWDGHISRWELELKDQPGEEEPEEEPEDDEETIQFALDDRPQTGSLPQKSESLAEKAARQQADRLRRSLRQLAEKTKADGGSLIAEVDGLLREFEPQLAEGIYRQWLAGWLGGAEEALSGLPPIETTGEPIRLPPIPPVAPPLIGNMGDDGEVVFPALDRALKSLASKRAVTRETFDAMTAQAREHAFTVAGGLRESAVEKIRDLLTKEIEEGPSLKGFADRVSAAFGRSPLGASHLETVYRAALSSSYSRGVESVLSLPMVEDEFPYRLYVPIHDARARDEHTKLEKLGLDGTAVYHRDDPTWKKFQPPWDYGCRCGWIALTIQDASRRGVKHAKQWLESIREAKAKGMYDGQAISQMPPVEFVEPPPFEPPADWRR